MLCCDSDRRDNCSPPAAHRGYTVTSVQTAPEALQLLKDAKQSGQDFDLVLTDLILPEVSGFDLIQDVVTGRNGISNVPVVVMSSEDSRESVMHVRCCFSVGALINNSLRQRSSVSCHTLHTPGAGIRVWSCGLLDQANQEERSFNTLAGGKLSVPHAPACCV